MICLLYGSDQTSCVAYASVETFGALIALFAVLWGIQALFKIILSLLGFNI
ncbi:hypothetical protein [Acinetobacter haemolyticus]|uniref:hypothetical protein n=1 Tax=Acinetobacter haemolyticus TaxID=29430 RepID=UPI00148F27E6|nr:hypothetical protein [Acinetobacter haemolyticus]